MGDHSGEGFQLAVAAGKLGGAAGHRPLQIKGVTVDPLQAGPVDVPQQLAAVAQFLQIGEGAEIEGLLDRIVADNARVDDYADVVVEAADLLEKLCPAKVGQPVIHHGHAEVPLPDVFEGFSGGAAADHLKSLALEKIAQQP